VEVPYSNHQSVERPFGFTVPETTAVVGATELASPVTTVGPPRVVNARSDPTLVPASLAATIRKWWVVPGLKPLTSIETDLVLVPEPTPTAALFAPYEVDVPYSNHAVVFRPFGLTWPFRRALDCPTLDAELVETLGAAFVANERSSPFAVPASLEATSRK
jgi:hypothetical protein